MARRIKYALQQPIALHTYTGVVYDEYDHDLPLYMKTREQPDCFPCMVGYKQARGQILHRVSENCQLCRVNTLGKLFVIVILFGAQIDF